VYHNVAEMVDLFDNSTSLDDFITKALALNTALNKTWLKTEYDTAQAAAQMANKWQDFQKLKKHLPYLKYVTVGDDRVRPAHRLLDGITKHIDDPFWDEWFPPLGYRCRCSVMQVAGGETPDPTHFPTEKQAPRAFRINPGKTGEMIGKEHPYFKGVPKEHAANIWRAIGQYMFDLLDDATHIKDATVATNDMRYVLSNPQSIGLDKKTGGFIAVHKEHKMGALADELPVLDILRKQGFGVVLLNESITTYDVLYDNLPWEIKRMRSSTNLDNTIKKYYQKCKDGNKSNLLIHIDQTIDLNLLKQVLQNKTKNFKTIQWVELIQNDGLKRRISRLQLLTGDWK
jgi:SPP1 gp7 family putative phage head morphogenesis protein